MRKQHMNDNYSERIVEVRSGPAEGAPETESAGWLARSGASRFLHWYWRFARGMTLGVRAAVIDRDDRVFLVRHTYTGGWHLPGGGVEAGETALDALKRELWEEGRIELIGAPRLHGAFFNARVSRRDHVLVYVVSDFSVFEPKRPDREIAEGRFFALDALPGGVTPGTRARLEEIVATRPPSATW